LTKNSHRSSSKAHNLLSVVAHGRGPQCFGDRDPQLEDA
jgi:hypothetical protein